MPRRFQTPAVKTSLAHNQSWKGKSEGDYIGSMMVLMLLAYWNRDKPIQPIPHQENCPYSDAVPLGRHFQGRQGFMTYQVCLKFKPMLVRNFDKLWDEYNAYWTHNTILWTWLVTRGKTRWDLIDRCSFSRRRRRRMSQKKKPLSSN